MNLSGISQIRNHLYRINVGEDEVRNRPIRLSSGEYTTLPHAHIVVASEVVKAIKNTVPSSEVITLSTEPVSLRKKHLAIGTVVCADDSSLSRVYQENLDYIIDFSAGTVTRTSGGAIPAEGKMKIETERHASDRCHQAGPADCGREVVYGMPDPLDHVVNVWKLPSRRIFRRLPGPVDEDRFPLDVLERHAAPES